MADKINLSLDDIIAKQGIGLNSNQDFNQRLFKKEFKKSDPSKVVIKVDNDSNTATQTSNKRKVDVEEGLSEATVGTTSGRGSHFLNTMGQIFVDNLKYEVNDDDIQQLFSSFGKLRRSAINYESNGRSAGSAFVVFERKADAQTAVDSLQNITLDGRALRLTLINTNNSSFTRTSNDVKSRVKKRAKELNGKIQDVWSQVAADYDSAPTERRNPKRQYNRSDDNDKEVVSAEDLDADLESYLALRKKE